MVEEVEAKKVSAVVVEVNKILVVVMAKVNKVLMIVAEVEVDKVLMVMAVVMAVVPSFPAPEARRDFLG